MKYCVKSRQPISILRKANEIRVEYRDREQILDFYEKLAAEKIYIITIPADTEIDEPFIEMLNEKGNIILELNRLNLITIKWCKEKEIKWYWSFPITTFYELNSIAALGPSYLLLGAPLSFSLNKIRKYNIPIRLIANEAGLIYIPTLENLCGSWIRPEGIPAYEKYVDTIDFVSDNLEQEATYYKIYAENKHFTGNLNFLIKHLNIDVNNEDIPSDMDEVRTTCGQRCMENNLCHFCSTGIRFSRSLQNFKNSINPQ